MQRDDADQSGQMVDLGAVLMATEVNNCTQSCSNGDVCNNCVDNSFATFEYAA